MKRPSQPMPLPLPLALALALSAAVVSQGAHAQTTEPVAKPAMKPVKTKAKVFAAQDRTTNSATQPQTPSKTFPATRVLQLTTQGEAVIDLPVQPGQLTHLVLPAGENFALPPATGQGARCDDETHLWCIAAQGRDLFIKAKPGATTNNLIVVTERNRYAFDLRAVSRGALVRLTLMAPTVVPATAPAFQHSNQTPFEAGLNAGLPSGTATEAPKAARTGDASDAQMVRVNTPPPDPQKLLADRMSALPMPRNTQYSMAVGKSSEDITPSLVFDDGRFTYLRFAGNRPLPAIFQNGPDGGEETVNVRMGEDDLMVTDRVARRLVLRLGQAVVVVVNDAFDIEGQPPLEGTTVPGVSRTLTQVPKPPVRLPAAMQTVLPGPSAQPLAQATQEAK